MASENGKGLVLELLANPDSFRERGGSYLLLEEFFNGLSLDHLEGLLLSKDPAVQHVAVFVASELGARSVPVADGVIPLLESSDVYVRFHALEVASVCMDAGRLNEGLVVALLGGMLDRAPPVRALAMRLISGVGRVTLQYMLEVAERRAEPDFVDHRRGLRAVLERERGADEALELIESPSALLRKYGTIAWCVLQQ